MAATRFLFPRPVPAVFMHNKQRDSLNLIQALCDDVLRLGN